jgi:hypothetical protein
LGDRFVSESGGCVQLTASLVSCTPIDPATLEPLAIAIE